MVPILVIMFFAIVIIYAVLATNYNERKTAKESSISEIGDDNILYPLNYNLFSNHIWISKSGDAKGLFSIGMDELLHSFIGTPDQIYLKNTGDEIKKGEQLAVLQNGVKEIVIKAPVSGIIASVNDSLSIQPDRIDTNPYDQGWLYTIKLSDTSIIRTESKVGLVARNWLKDEFNRLKEFLLVQVHQPESAVTTLMDGGWPARGVIDNVDNKVITLFEQDFLRI